MDDDPWLRLAIRAAATGRLNFINSTPITRNWVIKEKLILTDLADEALIDLYKLAHTQHSAAAQILIGPNSVYDTIYHHHYDNASLLYSRIGKLLQPWDQGWDGQVEKWLQKVSAGPKVSSLGAKEIAGLIKDYEAMVAEWRQEQKTNK